MNDLCGQQIAGYRVVRLLGRGGMAEVYEAEHTALGMRRAVKVFNRLEMYDTVARNGVVIYLAYETRACAIVGDVAINEVIPEGFWDGILAGMKVAFAAGSFTEGIIAAVEAVGNALSEYFPYQSDDVNEQPDEISFGGDEDEDEED